MRLATVTSDWWRVLGVLRSLFTKHSPLLYALVLILLSPLAANHLLLVSAQSESATLSGRVTDPQGAAVVGAEVVLTNMDTNIEQRTKSNGDGIYVFAAVQPGKYRVAAGSTGFKGLIKENLVLHTQDEIAENFALPLGSVAETVTVDARAVNIDTTDATVSTTIDRNFAENLPLDGRSFQTLLLLAPGTVMTGVSANGGMFSVSGQRTNANNFTVDGTSANLGGYLNPGQPGQLNGSTPNLTAAGTTQGMVGVDALQEFKIQTSSYAPEFGRQPGGQVALLTRSGTNQFHGTAFDYFRNTVLDANNWFNGYEQNPPLPKGADRQNDFGGTFGGPVLKAKTFFFFSYEGLRLILPSTTVTTVPSLRIRQEAAPAYQAILNSWPTPQGPETTVPCDSSTDPMCPPSGQELTGAAPYTQSQSYPTNLDSYSIKIDHTFSASLHLFGRYSDTSSATTSSELAPNLNITTGLTARALTVGLDKSLSASFENELRLNYSVSVSQDTISPNILGGAQSFNSSVLFPAPLTGGDASSWTLSLPNSTFSTEVGPVAKLSSRQANAIDNISEVVGAHQLKFGVDYRRLFPIFSETPLSGDFLVTSESDLISGLVSQASLNAQLVAHPIYTNLSLYGQDTWRASNRLTLTYGLRWEFNPAPGERDGIQPFNLVGINDPATASLAPLNSPMYRTTFHNFAPRIGFAYQARQSPGRQTVIRAGFGIFYDLDSETSAVGFSEAPFLNASVPVTEIPFPVANNVLSAPPVPVPTTPPYPFINAINPNLQLPYTFQWNVSVEQALGANQALTLSYVASAGENLLRNYVLQDFNANFGAADVVTNGSSSNYQSLQIQFNRRLSQGLQMLVGYTYSHSIDNASDAETRLSPSLTGNSVPNPNIDRGNSDFDVRDAASGALTYNIPSWNANAFSKAVTGGWSIDTIGVAQTGLPVDLVGGRYLPDVELPQQFIELRPNLVPGQPLYLYGAQCAATNGGTPCPGGRGFNPAAFAPVPENSNRTPTQPQGTLGRNVMRGFGMWQTDFAVHRQFNMTERVNLQFRSEFFNLFNHPNFSCINPSVQAGAGAFGLAACTLNQGLDGVNQLYQLGGPRSIQFALKMTF